MRSKILIIALVVLSFSCSTRKTEKEKTEESTKTDFSGFFRNSSEFQEFLKTDFGLKTNFDSNVQKTGKTESGEFTVSPIDNSKVGVYIAPNGEKHVLDNTTMTNKNRKEETETKKRNSGNSEEIRNEENKKKAILEKDKNVQGNTEENKTGLNKKTEREYSQWNLLWLLIPIVLWKLYKKYKSKISVV